MADSRNDLERWSALMDRQALGETLGEEEQRFCERFAEHWGRTIAASPRTPSATPTHRSTWRVEATCCGYNGKEGGRRWRSCWTPTRTSCRVRSVDSQTRSRHQTALYGTSCDWLTATDL